MNGEYDRLRQLLLEQERDRMDALQDSVHQATTRFERVPDLLAEDIERTLVNANTASAEVLLAAIEGLDMAGAQKIAQARESRHFRTVSEVNTLLGEGANCGCTVQSGFFEVRGRLRIGDAMVDERSLVRRVGMVVTTLWRERGAFDRE